MTIKKDISGRAKTNLSRLIDVANDMAASKEEVQTLVRLMKPAVVRDQKRQAGTRKPRHPDIDEWIDKQLAATPGAKSPELWSRAPDWIKDTIGQARFSKRVTAARKRKNGR